MSFSVVTGFTFIAEDRTYNIRYRFPKKNFKKWMINAETNQYFESLI